MLDPQTIQLIVLLVGLAFLIFLILGLIFGLFLLAKIRTQAVRINKHLDDLVARATPGATAISESKPAP